MRTYLTHVHGNIWRENSVPGFREWYRILRQHHAWSIFDSLRYAFWLSRNTQLLDTVQEETENFWREMAQVFEDAFKA